MFISLKALKAAMRVIIKGVSPEELPKLMAMDYRMRKAANMVAMFLKPENIEIPGKEKILEFIIKQHSEDNGCTSLEEIKEKANIKGEQEALREAQVREKSERPLTAHDRSADAVAKARLNAMRGGQSHSLSLKTDKGKLKPPLTPTTKTDNNKSRSM